MKFSMKKWIKWLKSLDQSRLNRINFVKQQARLNIVFLIISIPISFVLFCVALGQGMTDGKIIYGISDYIFDTILSVVSGLIIFIFIYKKTLLNIRRLHDCNMSGWFSIFSFIPMLNLFFILYLYCYSGNRSDNIYGSPQQMNGSVYNVFLALVVNILLSSFLILYIFIPLLYQVF